MAINVRNPETEALARQLAQATGDTLTAAITIALRERLARVRSLPGGNAAPLTGRAQRLLAIAEDAAPRWTVAVTSVDHGELLYDEQGLPA